MMGWQDGHQLLCLSCFASVQQVACVPSSHKDMGTTWRSATISAGLQAVNAELTREGSADHRKAGVTSSSPSSATAAAAGAASAVSSPDTSQSYSKALRPDR